MEIYKKGQTRGTYIWFVPLNNNSKETINTSLSSDLDVFDAYFSGRVWATLGRPLISRNLKN